MIRLDMSEYQERHTVARLVGAPPGYVGYDEGGQLTEAVRRRPYSVILLDEIEKAHGDVFNILLQVLDDGRLTDGQGRTVDFTNVVLIMTSNAGSEFILEDLSEEDRRSRVMAALRGMFRPEFLNRVDETVIFSRLTREQIRSIVDVQIQRLERRVAERKVTLDVSDAARDLLAREGYDPVYGARPLRRVVQRLIENPLAMAIIAGEVPEGATVRVDAEGDEIQFRTAEPAAVGG
jgi:ATP-dependent Clp protease ATP-binding subunit ClpB